MLRPAVQRAAAARPAPASATWRRTPGASTSRCSTSVDVGQVGRASPWPHRRQSLPDRRVRDRSARAVRVHVVDPSAYTPPYDHALCAALARAGADVELVTSRFAYGPVPDARGLRACASASTAAAAGAGGLARPRGGQARRSTCRTCCATAARRRAADVVHFQWLTVQPLDVHLLPRDRPLVLTAHDVLPREPRPGQRRAAAPAVRARRRRRRALAPRARAPRRRAGRRPREGPRRPPRRLRAPHAAGRTRCPLPPELAAVDGPVVLCFGLMRPYKGIDVLLEAWRGIDGRRAVGRRACRGWTSRRCERRAAAACASCRASSPTPRSRRSSAARTSSSCPTARSTSPACCSPRWPSAGRCCSATSAASPRWPRPAPPSSSRPATPARCTRRSDACSPTRSAASAWPPARAPRPPGPYSWDAAAARTLEVYARPASHGRQSPAVTALAVILWVALGLLVYAQVGYGAAARGWRARLRGRAARRAGAAGRSAARLGDRRRLPRGRRSSPTASPTCWRSTTRASACEVIVACDGSPDDTAARAREAGADVVLELPRGGKIRAQDAAVERARGEIVAFCDANALWEPGRAARARGAVRRPARRLRLRPGALRRRRRHQPGGPVLALRDGAARAGSRGWPR